MLSIPLSQLNTYFLVLMPMVVAFLAGVIRQDKFPKPVNEVITIVVVVGLALLQALLGGKLGGSPLAAFGIVAAYTTAFLHTPLGLQLQSSVQTNVLSLGKAPSQPTPALNLGELAAQLAPFLAQELMKISVTDMLPPTARQQQTAIRPVVQAPGSGQGLKGSGG